MAPIVTLGNASLEPSIVDVLRERMKGRKRGKKEKMVFTHTERPLAAIEHPLFLTDVDNGLSQFGEDPEWAQLFDEEVRQTSVPFFFDPGSTERPTVSSIVATENVLVKITVPKRTGRRRKKGSNGPWLEPNAKRKQGDSSTNTDYGTGGSSGPLKKPPRPHPTAPPMGTIAGHLAFPNVDMDTPNLSDDIDAPMEERAQALRLYDQTLPMNPKKLVRILKDTWGQYKLEGIGNIYHTHRYRSFADFDLDMGKSEFTNNFTNKVVDGDVQTMRDFAIRTKGTGQPGLDIVAAPEFSNQTLPFHYMYEQNPYVRKKTKKSKPRVNLSHEDDEGSSTISSVAETETSLVNIQATHARNKSFFVRHDHPGVPIGPLCDPPKDGDPELLDTIASLQNLLDERPLWTRRALFNKLGMDLRSWDLFKTAIQYVAYQFRSGPWHNAVIRFGVDPRTDPKYRVYQTLMFKLLRRSGEPDEKRRHRYHGKGGGPQRRGGSGISVVPPELEGQEHEDEDDEIEYATGVSTHLPLRRNPNKVRFADDEDLHEADNQGGKGKVVDHGEKDGKEDNPSDDSGEIEPRPPRGTKRYYHDGNRQSHIFDGHEYSSSGRVWQVCDVSDPLLSHLLSTSPVRPSCDTVVSGFYHAGIWKKVKAIMKLKMLAIRFKRTLRDADFQRVIAEYPDGTPPPEEKIPYFLLPNLRLRGEEMEELRGDGRWRRNPRPGAGRRYIEKDGSVREMPKRKMEREIIGGGGGVETMM